MCLAFHPEQPAILAGGSFNGEVLVWNTALTDEPLVASSQIGDYYHREPVSQVTWVFNLKKRKYEVSYNTLILL